MIRHSTGNLLNCDAYALVNPINCVGVMGGGLAAQFKSGFPENYEAYKTACNADVVVPGRMFVFQEARRLIINFPTKRHYAEPSYVEDIISGLEDLVNVMRLYRVGRIAIPALGCGLGGLDWNNIKPLIEGALLPFKDCQVFLFGPQ